MFVVRRKRQFLNRRVENFASEKALNVPEKSKILFSV
jgi:hypothetical protein